MLLRRWSYLILLAALAAGCASSARSRTPAAAGLPASAMAEQPEPAAAPPEAATLAGGSVLAHGAPGAGTVADSWTGRYEGLAKVYHQSQGQWRDGIPMHLAIQLLRGQRLGISGIAETDSFFLVVTCSDSLALAGEVDQSAGRYRYSLSRVDEGILGSVAEYVRGERAELSMPGDEWVFEVRRSAAP